MCALNIRANLASIDTELCGEDKSSLLDILGEFSIAFIDGFPKSQVTTGELEIRLIDPNKTVQRRLSRYGLVSTKRKS